MLQKFALLSLILIILSLGFYLFLTTTKSSPTPPSITPTPTIEITPSASPSATPTPKPLTFKEMSELYGPCVYLPTLMYHHVQSLETAKKNNQASLTVDTANFRTQMLYLKNKGYATITPNQLTAFLNQNTPLPPKPIMITFDDAYADFSTDAAPILKEFGLTATVFVPTGLVNNPGYLSWDTIASLAQNNFFFGNHTWSHKNVQGNSQTTEKEITTADEQLTDHNQNNPKIFAYPYGLTNQSSENLLKNKGYQFALTTKPGSILCVKKRLELPRLRIGNSPLSSYGL